MIIALAAFGMVNLSIGFFCVFDGELRTVFAIGKFILHHFPRV